MLKKIFAITLCFIITLFISGCASNQVQDNENYSENDDIAEDKKIGDVVMGSISPYSEGLMFLRIADDETIYCVDKNGTVIFESNDIVFDKDSKFMGGYAFVNVREESDVIRALCDKKGNITKPSDVGATEFYGPNEILDSGYVLATKIEATATNTKSQLGVLNTSFEWVVPLNEALYKEFADTLSDSYNENFVVNECFYSVKLAKSLNLKTGEISSVKLKDVTPSSKWGTPKSCDGYYRVENNIVIPQDGKYIDLADNVIRTSYFVNGVAPILYHNEDANMYFITLIDEKGSHLFEPIQITYAPNSFKFATDGNYLVYTEKNILVCVSADGKKINEFDLGKFEDDYMSISNGVIVINNIREALCFDSQLNELF